MNDTASIKSYFIRIAGIPSTVGLSSASPVGGIPVFVWVVEEAEKMNLTNLYYI